jgi:carbon starvation protein
MDSERYFPTHPGVLTIFQFRSISLDVILAPIIALQFGWLPAVLWLLVGVIFLGWIQGYLAAFMTVRSNGRSLTDIIGEMFNKKSRMMIITFLLAYLLIIFSQFSLLLASLFSRAEIPTAIFVLVISGFVAGHLIYRMKIPVIASTVISIMIAVAGIWASNLSSIKNQIEFLNQRTAAWGELGTVISRQGDITWQSMIWISIIFVVCYLAAIIPPWRFIVPFNYISGWMVILGFGLAVSGLFFGTITGSIEPVFEIPPLITTNHNSIGPIWPIMFVTLASGAVSGWHSLVSSYSTARQVEKEPLIKPIITWGASGETLIVLFVIVLTAAFGISSGAFDANQGFILSSGSATAFAYGISATWKAIGFPESSGTFFSTYLLTFMTLSVLLLVARYARIIQIDLLKGDSSQPDKPRLSMGLFFIATLIVLVLGFRQWLWILFAGTNQLLAALVLMVAAVWLKTQSKNYRWALIPAIFLYLTGSAAIAYNVIFQIFYRQLWQSATWTVNQIIGSSTAVLFAFMFFGTATYIITHGYRKLTRKQSTRTDDLN